MTSIIEENSIKVFGEKKEVVDRKMPVFFNPVMKLNRDISVLVLSAISGQRSEHSLQNAEPSTQITGKQRCFRIADPLAGSGIRSLRFKKELDDSLTKEIYVNDLKKDYESYFEKNLELNGFSKDSFVVSNLDANVFLDGSKGFDYIDIDPFGSPNPFLDSAIRALRSEGILAVTATDTSALCGSYPAACKRKYWATPLRNFLMHEFGLRILIRKVQMVGVQYEKALVPVFSYSRDHYMRVFFVNKKSKKYCDDLLKKHSFFVNNDELFGPVWTGELWNDSLVKEMDLKKKSLDKESLKFFELIKEESKIKEFGFFDIHSLAKNRLKGNLPKFEDLMAKLEKKGFSVSRTHFSLTGLKTDAPPDVVEDLLFSK